MKPPVKKEVYKPTSEQVGDGAYYKLEEIKGYNQGLQDERDYRDWVVDNAPMGELFYTLMNDRGQYPSITDMCKAIRKMLKERNE